MIYLLVVIWLGFVISALAIWLLTNTTTHRGAKFVLTALFSGAAIIASIWVYKVDRPILNPEIGGVVSQNYKEKWLGLDIEANIQNSGRQSSYAKSWNLVLDIKGKKFYGRGRFGEKTPEGALNLPELREQDFPPGKPVSGWLFFVFPDLLHTDYEPYLRCDSQSARDVNITLTVTDSKEERAFSQTRNLEDMRQESCKPLGAATKPQ